MKIVIFDTETTGLLKPDNALLEQQPKIIEFYGVAIDRDFNIVGEVNTFVNPDEPITPEITRITGIKDTDVDAAPTFPNVADDIFNLIDGANLLVAHNLAFDSGMLKNEFARCDKDIPVAKHNLCTVETTVAEYGRRYSLSALYFKLFGKYFTAHRAKNDVQALVCCFHNLSESGVINLDLYTD